VAVKRGGSSTTAPAIGWSIGNMEDFDTGIGMGKRAGQDILGKRSV